MLNRDNLYLKCFKYNQSGMASINYSYQTERSLKWSIFCRHTYTKGFYDNLGADTSYRAVFLSEGCGPDE